MKLLMDVLNKFPNEEACAAYLVKLRWPDGIACPRCESSKVYTCKDHFRCSDCKRDFSVRTGTIYESSRLPLRKWFAAMWLMSSSPKGISSCQLAREIGTTQKTAWFMLSRLREMVANNADETPLSGVVEVDEVYLGGLEKNKHDSKKQRAGRGTAGKTPVVGVRARDGSVRMEMRIETDRSTLTRFVSRNVKAWSTVITDEHKGYDFLCTLFNHHAVRHKRGEYVRGSVHTNSIESVWAILERGFKGV